MKKTKISDIWEDLPNLGFVRNDDMNSSYLDPNGHTIHICCRGEKTNLDGTRTPVYTVYFADDYRGKGEPPIPVVVELEFLEDIEIYYKKLFGKSPGYIKNKDESEISEPTSGYHTKEIPKGELGEFSKIKEEFFELEDAVNQGDIILQLCELSDMIGSIELYLEKYNLKLEDLKKFSDKTKSAFLNGKRR